MKIVDFTHIVENDMTAYCEEEKVNINIETTIEKDNYESRSLNIFTHTGTHIDSQRHMLSYGKYIDDYGLDELMGKAIMINLKQHISQEIDITYLEEYEEEIKKVKFVIINTGWSKFWKTDEYLNEYPVLSKKAIEYLTKFNIKAVGIDCISIGKGESEIINHKILLEKNILIIENLKIDENIEGVFELVIAPLKIKNSDGAPVRVFAIL